jgi:hypothetical protein
MNYDTSIFIDIVESVPGIIFLRRADDGIFHVHYYQGLKGNLVPVDVSDEDMPNDTAMDYLDQLGLADLIPRLFPKPVPIEDIIDEIEDVKDSSQSKNGENLAG